MEVRQAASVRSGELRKCEEYPDLNFKSLVVDVLR
jgi:hypothetical protein